MNQKTLEIIPILHVLFCCGYYIEQAHINNKRIRIILIFYSNNYYNNKLPLSDEISILFAVLSVRSNHCKSIYRTVWCSLSWSWYQINTNKTEYILHYGTTVRIISNIYCFYFFIANSNNNYHGFGSTKLYISSVFGLPFEPGQHKNYHAQFIIPCNDEYGSPS